MTRRRRGKAADQPGTLSARAAQTGDARSVQPRFSAAGSTDILSLAPSVLRWLRDDFEKIPPYGPDSRRRARWLNEVWRNEPYLSGVINSCVQIDRNRGWSLVGGRNQVIRFTKVLHNWYSQPGRASWRDGAAALALAFYTQDIGGLAEVGRQSRRGPMAGLFHLDPTRCVLTNDPEKPVRYYPSAVTRKSGPAIDLEPVDYIRVASGISIDETYNGLGYCALSRAIELAITMVAVWRHEQEQLFARAPKGLLLLRNITQQQWNEALQVKRADEESNRLDWYNSVAVLATAGPDEIEAKLVALSNLPQNFDQKTFTDLLIYGYALCFGYDPREFWPVSSGALGTATETEQQHRKATGKGGAEFCLALQEEIQANLPDTLHFEFDQRDAEGELIDAKLSALKIESIMNMADVLTREQRLALLAKEGIIPREWTEGYSAIAEATDLEAADSPDNEGVALEAEEAERLLDLPAVRRAREVFPGDPLVKYTYLAGVERMQFIYRKPPVYYSYSFPPFLRGRLAGDVR